ncbi:MAG: hypothetical protein PHP85_11110 [Gallionella sp.]|nr:hypothetical protein [Gallionella sp.]
MMKNHVIFACMLAFSSGSLLAAEQYKCALVSEGGDGQRRADASQYVELTLEPGSAHSRIHIAAATRDMTFSACSSTPGDGSNFSKWFALECRKFSSLDGSPFTMEAFLADAYAGISPPVEPGYSMYATLSSIGEKLGIGKPERTFVIYADRKPQYEFFCYPLNTPRKD